mmetsp:Transcript_30929/g.74700  ORF Transcript_30929/g.74700 Transcript_30929/m.74700 type:complete len:221 (+) Transcript_30929:430-1092(+)
MTCCPDSSSRILQLMLVAGPTVISKLTPRRNVTNSSVGDALGTALGLSVVGASVGVFVVGSSVGVRDGDWLVVGGNESVEKIVGLDDGVSLSNTVGDRESAVFVSDGIAVGNSVSDPVGALVVVAELDGAGVVVGDVVGSVESGGTVVDTPDGDAVSSSVGLGERDSSVGNRVGVSSVGNDVLSEGLRVGDEDNVRETVGIGVSSEGPDENTEEVGRELS